jgi:hypothetical protein
MGVFENVEGVGELVAAVPPGAVVPGSWSPPSLPSRSANCAVGVVVNWASQDAISDVWP